MKMTSYFKSSLIVAASGLSVGVGRADVITINHNLTSAAGFDDINFDITGDATSDYRFHFSGVKSADVNKPQISTFNFGSGGINRIVLNSIAGDDYNTLPVLGAETVIGPDLAASLGGVLGDQGFFYQNWNGNRYGDWGGPGGVTAPDPVLGPITGYLGLAIPTDNTLTSFNYGYAHFTVDMTAPTHYVTLLDTGYETTPNQAITTPVPEPGTAALLVAGSAGLLALRRRRARG